MESSPLNTLVLTSQQVADLYANVLVETPASAVPAPVIAALGGNGKQILILVSKENEAYLPDAELAFLTTVLGACKLNLGDIALVNHARLTETDYQNLLTHFNSQTVLLFNIAPVAFGLPINFPPFQIQRFGGHTYLHAPDLGVIEGDVSLKKQLWAALKQLFSL